MPRISLRIRYWNTSHIFTKAHILIRSIQLQATIEEKCTTDEITHKVHEANLKLKELYKLKGWREEFLPVSSSYGTSPAFHVERAMVPYFGVKAYGVHINGFVYDFKTSHKPRVTHMYVGRRSPTKSTYPSMLDHLVAGGQPSHISLKDNVVKECGEEANVPKEIAMHAIPTGAISYNYAEDAVDFSGKVIPNQLGNLKRDVLFCYDLPLPDDFIPSPADGEVEGFMLKEVGWILEKMIYDDDPNNRYKPNCILVIIDFFIRHGIIDPESPGYLQLVRSLRPAGCS